MDSGRSGFRLRLLRLPHGRALRRPVVPSLARSVLVQVDEMRLRKLVGRWVDWMCLFCGDAVCLPRKFQEEQSNGWFNCPRAEVGQRTSPLCLSRANRLRAVLPIQSEGNGHLAGQATCAGRLDHRRLRSREWSVIDGSWGQLSTHLQPPIGASVHK